MKKLSFFKRLKKYNSKFKWYKKFILKFLTDKYFRIFIRDENLKAEHAENFEKTFRKLLSLDPTWARGHYLIARIAFALFENSKVGSAKGLIRLSKKALEKLNADPKILTIVGGLYNFTDKNYAMVIRSLENLLREDQSLNIVEKNLCFELLGSSYLIEGPEPMAMKWFEEIDPHFKSNEVKQIISLLKSNNRL